MLAFLHLKQHTQLHMLNKEIQKRESPYNETYHRSITIGQSKNHSIKGNDKI